MNILYYLQKNGIKIAAGNNPVLTPGSLYRGAPFSEALSQVNGLPATPESNAYGEVIQRTTRGSLRGAVAGEAVPFAADAWQLAQAGRGLRTAADYATGEGGNRTRAHVLNMSLPPDQATVTPEQVAQSRGTRPRQQAPQNKYVRKSDWWSAFWQNLPYYYFGRT